MKTTVEIADPLLDRAKRLAKRQGVTVRALIERGLRLVVAEAENRRRRPFRLRRAGFKGTGLQPEFRDAPWAKLRAAIYEDRGG